MGTGKRMIGKGITIGRSVVALQDLFVDLEDHEEVINNKTVQKIISIHKLNKTKRTGFSSGQGHKKIVKSSSTFSKFLRFGSKRSEEEYLSSSSDDDEIVSDEN